MINSNLTDPVSLKQRSAQSSIDPSSKAFQAALKNWVIDHGGRAEIQEPVTARPDWDKLKDVLLGNSPISSFEECN